jgi:glycerol-1-phosphate dehydrogenase [NAD(P)+]
MVYLVSLWTDLQNLKQWFSHREIIVGHNTTTQIAELCDRIGRGNCVLIVEDKKTRKLSGEDIKKILSKANYNVQEKLVSAPTIKEVNRVINFSHKNKIDLLLGVGGGSIIDITKFAAYELKKPFISVPTSAAHDGIASPRASLKSSKGSVSKTAVSPLAILADTKIIHKAPQRMLIKRLCRCNIKYICGNGLGACT